MDVYAFRAELWQYEGPGAWYFVSLPPDIADDIRAKFGPQTSGFGSVKVSGLNRVPSPPTRTSACISGPR